MKFIDFRLDRTAAAILAADTFEQLQEAFHTRLRKDRVRLVVLSNALAHCGENSALPFEELASFAHRLRGASAIFGATEIQDAAHELEVAAHAARDRRANAGDSQVWSALALLADVLAAVTDSTSSPALPPVRPGLPARDQSIVDTRID
jgi:HPt (histidine-containing phosphotransfer) domain-containing protein